MVRFVEAQDESDEESSSSSESEAEEEQGQDPAEESASDSDEGDGDGEDDGCETTAERVGQGSQSRFANGSGAGPSGCISISLGRSKLVCHVCGKKGHCAGFQGASYMDCPNKPCYLCKQPGHTTASCPHRADPDATSSRSGSGGGIAALLRSREQQGVLGDVGLPKNVWQVDAAVLKLHSRRCTCLEFHPTRDSLVLSGDKKGQVAIWDFEKVHERTVYNLNRALTNNLRFVPGSDSDCISASSDGKLRIFDVETGQDSILLDLNPGGWIEGVTKEKEWKMMYALDASGPNNLILAGDSFGFVHFVDVRSHKSVGSQMLHKKAKVNTIQVNPVDSNLMVSAGNDWVARLFDLRMVITSLPDTTGKHVEDQVGQLGMLPHTKVVNSAYFSPLTGQKLLTTCIDNRIRIWDYLAGRPDPAPDREIVHSHDFNRYLTPFRAEWDPKDPSERLFVIGRYISDVYDGQALHPIDMYDGGNGALIASLIDPNLNTICPVNKPHPRLDVLVSGSSRSLYAWRPYFPDEEMAGGATAAWPRTGGLPPPNFRGGSYTFCDAEAPDADDDAKKKRRASGGATELDPTEQKKERRGGASTATNAEEKQKKQTCTSARQAGQRGGSSARGRGGGRGGKGKEDKKGDAKEAGGKRGRKK